MTEPGDIRVICGIKWRRFTMRVKDKVAGEQNHIVWQ